MTPPEPIQSPAVWRGEELLSRTDWLHELTEIEQREIDAFRGQPASGPSGGQLKQPPLLDQAPEFCRRLTRIQDSLETGSGAVMIRGLNLAQWELAPLVGFFEMFSSMVGTPLSQNIDGDRIFSVRDAGFAENDPRNRGPNTKKRLSFHTDRCDVIGFLCVCAAKSGGENQLVSSAALFNEILDRRPDLLTVLMQPFCYLRHNFDTANQLPYTQQPIFSFHQGVFAANFLRVLIDRAHKHPELPSLSPIQQEALDYLEQVAADPKLHITFRQQPGDVLFMNNWITFHRRTAFEDFAEPELKRHILRVWLSMPNSRAIDPRFAGNYGATGAGEIRGGIHVG